MLLLRAVIGNWYQPQIYATWNNYPHGVGTRSRKDPALHHNINRTEDPRVSGEGYKCIFQPVFPDNIYYMWLQQFRSGNICYRLNSCGLIKVPVL